MPSQNSQILITVFTPAYNRAHLLPRLYESLCAQSFQSFEWLIVDDGSKDDTEKVVSAFIAEDKLNIRYIKQSNGGKHRAINHGVKEAKGDLFFIVDSDDSIPCDSLESISTYYYQIEDDKSFGGVVGLMAHHDGSVITQGCNSESLDATSIELRYKYHIVGDMAEVFRTEVLREFAFPDIEGERFCPEALVWNRIAMKYRLRYFKKVIYYRDYIDGGLTSKIVRIRMNSSLASMICYSELNKHHIPFVQKTKAAINYWRFSFCSDQDHKPQLSFLWIWTMPIGYLMHCHDVRCCK
jgi:glycosyltransferase involved in cell wall biosynthesis